MDIGTHARANSCCFPMSILQSKIERNTLHSDKPKHKIICSKKIDLSTPQTYP